MIADGKKQYKSYSAAVRRAVGVTFNEKEEMLACMTGGNTTGSTFALQQVACLPGKKEGYQGEV
ncbi:hypothetical protein RG963_05735 [Methanosarcina sp. Z-7115]|uniref:Threonine synthase n=1 Tax=Methanosarcina baikalica TaxID=3073890 RepID=A0ABU2D0D0_9EURY|nr:hypothetical protein [Methanosarcina sp. Z-7115]MDR7665292.1 hypothetical protein [Methanosarcina sp. Z-7115]